MWIRRDQIRDLTRKIILNHHLARSPTTWWINTSIRFLKKPKQTWTLVCHRWDTSTTSHQQFPKDRTLVHSIWLSNNSWINLAVFRSMIGTSRRAQMSPVISKVDPELISNSTISIVAEPTSKTINFKLKSARLRAQVVDSRTLVWTSSTLPTILSRIKTTSCRIPSSIRLISNSNSFLWAVSMEPLQLLWTIRSSLDTQVISMPLVRSRQCQPIWPLTRETKWVRPDKARKYPPNWILGKRRDSKNWR